MENELQNLAFEAIKYDDRVLAVEVLNKAKKDPSVSLGDRLIQQLSYLRMNSLNPDQLLALVKKSILVSFEIPDFNFDERMRSYFDQMDNMNGQYKLIKNLIVLLEECEETLGKEPLIIKGVKASPTIGNWLTDYIITDTTTGKDAFTELQYMNSSPNVNHLSVQEKEILKNLIKFLDYCFDFVRIWDSIPTPKSDAEAFPDFDLYQFIPGLDLDDETEPASQSIQAAVESAPRPAYQPPMKTPAQTTPLEPRPVKRSIDEIIPQQRQSQPPRLNPMQSDGRVAAKPLPGEIYIDEFSSAEAKGRALPQKPQQPKPQQPKPPTPQPVPAPRPQPPVQQKHNIATEHTGAAKIHDLINSRPPDRKGIVKDPTNIKISEEQKRLEQERAKQASRIQDKLQDLRNRKKE